MLEQFIKLWRRVSRYVSFRQVLFPVLRVSTTSISLNCVQYGYWYSNSVCLSVCPSVTLRYCIETAKHTHTHTHNFIQLLKRQHNYTQNNKSENLTNQQYKTLKRHLMQSAQWRHIMFSEAENFCINLHFLLLTETDGNGQLNIPMQQQLATSFDLVLKIFINVPTTIWSKE